MTQILMAVCNGERYLSCQIESILAQSDTDWHLYICDDGSSDNSFAIAEEYASNYSGKITAVRNEVPTGSACANFMRMLRECNADYIFFSDQDDYWLPDKIRLTREKMKAMEEKYGDLPFLVHGELEIVNEALEQLAPGFTKYQGIDPKYKSLNRLLCQNNITGCTVMMNRALADIVKYAPPEAMLMHDWWAGLAAAAFGHIGFVDKPLIKYRQHGGNQLGAVNNRNLAGAVRMIRDRQRTRERIDMTYRQAKSFCECYKSLLSEDKRHILETYIDIPSHSKPVRAARLIKYGFLKQNFSAAAGQLIFC